MDEDFDPPFADPSIRTDYESELGRFLVRFNEIEFEINALIHAALMKAGRSDLAGKTRTDRFEQAITNFELLSIAYPPFRLSEVVASLRHLGNRRNILAHGHFDQNPFQGDYELARHGRPPQAMSVAEIRLLTLETDRVIEALRAAHATFWFEPIEISAD